MNRTALFIAAIISLILLMASAACAQDRMQDVVYLKNGSIIRGMIIEQIPNKTLKVQTADGSVFVFQMDDVVRITKEAVPAIARSNAGSVSSTDKVVLAVNPLGAIVGGVSWIAYERSMGNNLTYQIRGDIWTYKETEDEGGYYYHETQLGFGIGGSARAYVLSSQPYSGLFGAFGLDALYTGWDWEKRWTKTSPLMNGDGSTMTVVFSAQVGFAIALSNVRLEPSIAAGYFALRQEGAGVAGVFVGPALQVGIAF
jgi:hypothetical protein